MTILVRLYVWADPGVQNCFVLEVEIDPSSDPGTPPPEVQDSERV